MQFEQYNFQNIYIITTYRCNWNCPFCLFKFNEEKEAHIEEMIDRLEYAIVNSDRRVYIKITGGEPFIMTELLEAIFRTAAKYKDKVYKIGIGTNGSIPIPEFFNDVVIRTHIFLSRHNIVDALPIPAALLSVHGVSNKLIDFRINCNMVKGEVDSLDKIIEYLEHKFPHYDITHFCFRQLNRVDINKNKLYPPQIYDYEKYYKKHLVPMSSIEAQIKRLIVLGDKRFTLSRNTGNFYDTNHWYWYQYNDDVKLSVKFRGIDERLLVDYNTNVNPDGIDEYVIHPDGTLTGCWDKDLKLIIKGGDINAEQTIHC